MKDEKLNEFEELAEKLEQGVNQEMYVRKEEAKAHEEWMRLKDEEEKSMWRIVYRV